MGGRRGQAQKGCGDKRRQVMEPETRAGKVWSGSTAAGEAGLGRFILGQVPAPLLVRWGCRAEQGLRGG